MEQALVVRKTTKRSQMPAQEAKTNSDAGNDADSMLTLLHIPSNLEIEMHNFSHDRSRNIDH